MNVFGEGTKGGLGPREAREEIALWAERLPNLKIRGLMTMAPFVSTPEDLRPGFRELREIRDEIAAELPAETGEQFRELSMGMTNDYTVAVSEGATQIRLGRVLYE